MNKYSLQFKSRECEGAFGESLIHDENFLSTIGIVVNILQFIALLVYLFFQLSSDSSLSYILNLAALPASFFVLACVSQCLKFLLKQQSRLLNVARLIKNVLACIIIGVADRYGRSSDDGGVKQSDNFQPLLGFILAVEIVTSLQGTNFLLKILSVVFNIAFYTTTFWSSNSAALSIAFTIGIGYFLARQYLDDKTRRNLFLDQQKSTELSFLIDKLLPINIVVMKYNHKEERSFLHQVNRKAQHTFSITDNDSFKAFSKRIIIKTDTNDPDNSQDIDPADLNNNPNNDLIEASPFPQLYPSQQAPSMMNLNHSEANSHQHRVLKQRPTHQRTLFFYMESIAKDTFDRQKRETTVEKKTVENGRKLGDIHNRGPRRSKKDSVMIVDRTLKASDDKVTSLMMPGFAKDLVDEQKDKDFASNEKINSVDSPKKESYMLSFDRRSKKDSNSDRQKINSIDNRPKGFSVEKTALALGDRTSLNSAERERQQRQNNTSNNVDNGERTKRLGFETTNNNNNNNNNSNSNNGQGSSAGLGGFARRTHTVKLESLPAQNINNGRVGGGNIRRNGRKTTVMRKIPNFNLNPGTAGVTKKYGEDVYDRIDMLTGEYSDAEGRLRQISIKIYTYNVNEQYQVILFEDETLESQVKFLKEHNKFLYASFTDSLEVFRLPLAYSLLKLNAAYEEQQKVMKTSQTFGPQQTAGKQAIDGSRQPSMILQQSDASLMNISPTSRKNIYPQSNQMAFSSNQHVNFINTQSTKQHVDLWTNLEEEESISSSSQNLINPLFAESVHQEDKRRANSVQLDRMNSAVDNSRYYGFLTLNAIYNYIDYISMLQHKQLEVKVNEISMKKTIMDVVSLLENQGKKKSVRIIVLNELRYDRLSSDERRMKQLLLNFLIPMLERTKKGYIAIRLSHSKQFESIKVSISSSCSKAYPAIQRAKLKLISFEDVVSARRNKSIVAHTVSTSIVGRLGPYSKISLKYEKESEKSGTTVSFSIYQDINILASVNRFGSQDDNDLLFNQQAAFKSNANVQQEGEISELSSCDINYKVNKILIENQNRPSQVFFPHSFQETASIIHGIGGGGDENTIPSSKKQAISPSKYSLYSDNHFERAREFSGHFDGQLRSRSASSRSLDVTGHRFDASRGGVKSQNNRLPSSEEEQQQPHHDDGAVSRKYLDQNSRNERTAKQFNDPKIIEDASCHSERQQRKLSNARHHSEYIPSNSPSYFNKAKEPQYQSVLSFPKESTMLLNPKRDLKTLKIPKKTLNGVSESASQLLSLNNEEPDNNSDEILSGTSNSASRLQMKRLSKIATSASTIKVHRNYVSGGSDGHVLEQGEDSHLVRHKDGLIKLQLVDLSENQIDMSKTASNITSLTHILP